MLKNRIAAAKMVTTSLSACEKAVDDALISVAELTVTVPTAQRHANISPVVTQNAMMLAGEALAALHEARAKVIATHNALAGVRDQIGLRTYAGGSLWKLAEPTGADNEGRIAA